MRRLSSSFIFAHFHFFGLQTPPPSFLFCILLQGEEDVDTRAEIVKALAPEAVKRLEALEELQKAADANIAAMLEERKALELKYHALNVVTWKQRSDILTGVTDPAASAASTGIPKFWLQAMSNHATIADFIEERDEEALASLKDITWEYLPELKARPPSEIFSVRACSTFPTHILPLMQGFKLSFTFGPNDFFEDAVLTKEFHVPNLLDGKAIELEKSIG